MEVGDVVEQYKSDGNWYPLGTIVDINYLSDKILVRLPNGTLENHRTKNIRTLIPVKEETMARPANIKVGADMSQMQTLTDSIAALQDRLDGLDGKAKKKSMTRSILFFPIKIMLGRLVLTVALAGGALGYAYYTGTKFELAQTSQEVVSYLPSKKLLKVLDNGKQVSYVLKDQGWVSVADFRPATSEFLERVRNQIEIDGFSNKALPVEKNIFLWKWVE